ncbi:hypothetical protein H8356DRAFT_1647762 [Neocallimastix lanati (nom. inval.)]|nr:hypothetical protein H8356DRAFT_1647762 [Neocallimastix sp. JGI-2020a]
MTLVENETEKIREKLNLALSINENLLSLGYCMDIELIKNVALYDKSQMRDFNIFLPAQIKTFIRNNNIENGREYEPAYPNFPDQHINNEFFYFFYCKWLYNLEHASINAYNTYSLNVNEIPSSYKHIFDNKETLKSDNLYKFLFTNFFRDDLKFITVSLGKKEEYYQMISNMMSSPFPLSSEDISDLRNFIKYETRYLEYIPSDIPSKYNLGQISKLLFNHDNKMSQKDIIPPRFKEVVVDDVLNLVLTYNNQSLSNNVNSNIYLEYFQTELIVELLKKCNNRYYQFIKKSTRWKIIFRKIRYRINNFDKLYPDLNNEANLMEKYLSYNSIYINRANKMIMYEENVLNNYFKCQLEKALNNNALIANSKKYHLIVKKCNFINCILILNNTVELEYENSKCIRGAKAVTDDTFMETLNSIVEKETDIVKEKLKNSLILIENLANYGYILSPDLIQIISFYDKYEIYELGLFLMRELTHIPKNKTYNSNIIDFKEKDGHNNNDRNNNNDDDTDDDFSDSSIEQIYQDDDSDDQDEEEIVKYVSDKVENKVDTFYYYYCKWLYYVEKSVISKGENLNSMNLPLSYKKNKKIINRIKEKDENNNLKWKIICSSNEDEFYKMIQEMFASPSALSVSDIKNLEDFIISEKNYWNYIPNDIPNKDNLVRIINKIYVNDIRKNNYEYFRKDMDILTSESMNRIVSLFHNVNEVLKLIICMSRNSDEVVELNTFQSIKIFDELNIKFIFKILDHCDSTTRYESFMKYPHIWSRFCNTIDHQKLKVKYNQIIEDLLSVSKDYNFRALLLKRRNKLFIDKMEDENLDTYYKNNLEKSIQNDSYFLSYPQFKIKVKQCHLLYCSLTLNENQKMEFENGKLFTEPPSELTDIIIELDTKENMTVNDSDDEDNENNNNINNNYENDKNNTDIKIEESLMDHLKEIVEVETKNIREKLNLVLSLNENIYSAGYIMEVDLVEILALYTPYELEELSKFFIEQLLSNKENINLPFPSFPNMYLDIKKAFYYSYCKWLSRLERIFHFNETVIPMSFKKFLFKDDKIKEKSKEKEEENDDDDEEEEEEEEEIEDIENENEDKYDKKNEREKKGKYEIEDKETRKKRIKYEMNIDTNDAGLKIVMLGEREEFYQTIVRIMVAPEAFNANDLSNLRTFIQFEKNHLKYIPEIIPNKENLVNIVNLLLKHYSYDSIPEDVIIPLFRNVNDVLRLALVLSDHSASDLGKPQRFKSFSNPERRLFMKLLNNCSGDRYDDLIKYHNIWSRFFEKIHPLKFKKIYPDLIEDLLGTYRFVGEPEIKQLMMEYSFYQLLLKLNERLMKYREDTLKLIQYKQPVENILNYLNRYNINSEIRNSAQFFNLEFLDQNNPNDDKDPIVNYKLISEKDIEIVRTIVRNLRINRVLADRNFPLTLSEHEKIIEKFHNLTKLPEEMKKYLYFYLQSLVTIFSGGLKGINEVYQNEWDTSYRMGGTKKYYDEYIHALRSSSDSLYRTVIPILDVDLIQKRMNEIIPQINQTKEKVRRYRKERQTFNSKWVELISNKKIEEAAKILSRKPGIFLRQLDELVTKSEKESEKELILQLFEEATSKVSIKVLLSMKGYFQKRTKSLKGRAFLIQGGYRDKKTNQSNRLINTNQGVVTKTHTVIYYTTKVKKPLDDDMCQKIVRICDEALIRNFQNKTKLNRVYISPDIQKFVIPYDLRSVKKTNGNMCAKGSRFNIKFKDITDEYREKIVEDLQRKLEKNKKKVKDYLEKKRKFEVKYVVRAVGPLSNKINKRLKTMEKKLDILKSFVQKNEEELENIKYYQSDNSLNYIRLYVVGCKEFTIEMFDDNLQLKRIYPTLKNYDLAHQNLRSYNRYNRNNNNNDNNNYSDEEENNDDIFYYYKSEQKFYDIDFEKIVQNGIRYIVVSISEGNNIKFGWMKRRALNSSEKFNPEILHQNFNFNYKNAACPLIVDCKTREFIWIDKEYENKYYNYYRKILEYIKDKDKDQSIEINNTIDNNDRQRDLERMKNNKKWYDRNLRMKYSLFYYYLEPLKISINDLIQLHIKARDGIQVENEEELEDGDLAFLAAPPINRKDNVHYIFYHQHDTILANFMTVS